jgi:hypothetical protein
MSEAMAKAKYPMEKRPGVLLSNQNGTVSLGLSVLDVELECSQEDYVDWAGKTIKAANAFNRVLNRGVEVIDGMEMGFMEFMSRAVDAKIYNLMFFAAMGAKLLQGSFNCVDESSDIWEPVGKAMVLSIKFPEGEDEK